MNLRKSNKTKKTKIAIIGLGYVGLPLLLKFLDSKKYEVIGIDNDKNKISSLQNGKSYISHISNSQIKFIRNNSKNLTNDFKSLKNCDCVVFALPTPLTKNKDPDMSYIQNAINLSENYFRKNQTIILESTVYPGATEEFFLPIIKKKEICTW